MNLKQWLFLLSLYCIPWIAYFFLNPNMVGYDTYYYLHLLNILPNQFWILKLILFFLGLIFLFGVMALAKHFQAKPFYVGLSAITLSPIIFIIFSMFENDQFAFAFFPWIVLMALQKSNGWKLAALVSLVGAGLVWKGAIYYLLAFGFTGYFFVLPAIIAFFVFDPQTIITTVLPLASVNEAHAIEGLAFIGLLLPGLLMLNWKQRELAILTIFFLIIGVINAKFIFHVFAFMAILFYFFVQKVIEKWPKTKDLAKKLVYLMPIYLLVVWSAVVLTYPPGQTDIKMVQEYISYKPELPHKNDWSYGHWIRYYGLEPTAWAGGYWEQDYNHGIIMTSHDLNCKIVFDYNLSYKVFDC